MGTPASSAGGDLSSLGQMLAGIANAGTGSGTLSLTGSSSTNLGLKIWVPNGQPNGYKQVTIQQFVNDLRANNPSAFTAAIQLAQQYGYITSTDPSTQANQLADAIYAATGGSSNFNINDFPQWLQQQPAAGGTTGLTGGYTRFFRGSATEIPLTTQQGAAAAVDATYQQLLGRRATTAEINSVVGSLNSQELTKGAADVATNQAQQEGYAMAFSQGATSQPGSAGEWASQVLQDAGLPVTEQNVTNMLIWMQNENPPSGWAPRNNPLNASLGTSASDGTAGYKDLATAAQFTAQMIKQDNMKGIFDALSSGTASQAEFGQAVIDSPWASSHYGHNLDRFTGTPTLAGEASQVTTSGQGGYVTGPDLAAATPNQPVTAGQPYSFQAGNSKDVVMAPTVTVTQQPATAADEAYQQARYGHPLEFQSQNLVNVFGTISKMFGSPQGALDRPVTMP